MCRKLETEEEKVLPFYSSSLSVEDEEATEAAMTEPPVEALAEVCTDWRRELGGITYLSY